MTKTCNYLIKAQQCPYPAWAMPFHVPSCCRATEHSKHHPPKLLCHQARPQHSPCFALPTGHHWDKPEEPPVLQTHQLLLLHHHKHFSNFYSVRNKEEHQAKRAKRLTTGESSTSREKANTVSEVPSNYLLAAHKSGEILIPHRWQNHHLNKTSLMIVTEGTFNIACT